MDLELLESLMAVAETGTITEAARRIHLSQPALSRRLQQLEAELGAELLVRGRHGAELTVVGQQAVAHARTIVARYEQLRREIAEHLGLHQGIVRIGGGATVTSFLLPAAIARFRAQHPGIRFYVKESGSHDVASDVAAGAVEIGIVTLPVPTEDVDVVELFADDIVLVARADHPLAGKRVSPSDLRGQTFIAFEPGSAIRHIIDGRLRRAGLEPEVTMELRSIPSILRMVSSSSSMAFVSRLSLTSEPDLRAVPVRGLSISRTLALVTRTGFPLSAPGAAFALTLREVVAGL